MGVRATLDGATAGVRAAVARRASPSGERLPLSALRMRLDDASQGAQWAMHPDGVLGRALMMPAPATVSFPITLSGEVVLRTRVMLLPHDWRDGRGAITASVS